MQKVSAPSLRLVIIGNSGSGKSTLARKFCEAGTKAHLDLDILAWLPGDPPVRRPLGESQREIELFTKANPAWVIEGCYSDLLEIALRTADELIFLDLPVEECIENAGRRPWEPHKYESREAQDANLKMLIDWIARYPDRDDLFSRTAHRELFDGFGGKKAVYTSNRNSSAGLPARQHGE